mmetsp:Transcript_13851/g.30294  ORF Transcript_13851/g.30294 Transcript_13851/m.30294 type:complete len:222 (+) Transcript_13851:103-768(+)
MPSFLIMGENLIFESEAMWFVSNPPNGNDWTKRKKTNILEKSPRSSKPHPCITLPVPIIKQCIKDIAGGPGGPICITLALSMLLSFSLPQSCSFFRPHSGIPWGKLTHHCRVPSFGYTCCKSFRRLDSFTLDGLAWLKSLVRGWALLLVRLVGGLAFLIFWEAGASFFIQSSFCPKKWIRAIMETWQSGAPHLPPFGDRVSFGWREFWNALNSATNIPSAL